MEEGYHVEGLVLGALSERELWSEEGLLAMRNMLETYVFKPRRSVML